MAQESTKSEPAMDTLPDAPGDTPAKAPVRSFKKKYAKMKVKFDHGIRENENLIREELRIEDLSKRIQEQNDQLLEVLLEFNDSLQVSPTLRYDLNMPANMPSLPAETEVTPLLSDATLARTALKEARTEMANGNFSTGAYRQVEESVKRNKEFAPALQYDTLSKVPHTATTAPDVEKVTDGVERRLGYFTPEHETEYYLSLDAKLGDEAAATQLARIPDRPTFAERERDANARNPASVQNWLRRNQPQNLQEHEVASEKSTSRPSNQRASKRAPARKEEETFDEDGMEIEPTPKNKRKREEDTGYRPKGGSSRSKKKKEESTPTANRSSKKT